MALYTLPDGSQIDLPENLTDQQKEVIKNYLAEKYPSEFGERTFGGQALEVAKGIPRGFISGLSSAVEGVGELIGLEGLAQSQRDFQQSLRESNLLGADKRYEDTYVSKLGEGLGSFASFFVPSTLAAKSVGAIGKGGKALSQAERAKEGAKRATYTAGAIAAPIGVSEQTDRIREAEELGEEVSFGEKKFAQLAGLGVGLTELLPAERLFKILRRVPKSTGQELRITDRLTSAFKQGGAEGLQEAGAQILQDVVARGVYSDELPIGQSAADEFSVGAGVGFIADLAVRGRGRPATGTVEEIKQEEKLRESMDVKLKSASETKQKLLEQGSPTINPNNVVSEEQIAQEEEYIPEDVKPAESVKLMPSPDGSVNIVGTISGNVYANTTQDKAGQEAAKIEDQIRSESTSTLVNDLNFINGNAFNGTAFFIGQKIHNPYSTQVAIDQITNQDTNLKTFKNETKAEAMRRKMKRKKIDPAKSYVSFAEAKKLLSPKDFNNLMINRSQAQEQTNVLDLKRKPLTYEKDGKVSVSKPTFNKLLKEKNIDTSLTSPEFEFFLEQTTGAKTFASANKGQKQVALAKIQSFPKFKKLTPLPNYRPRPYSGRQLQEFVRNYKETGQSKPITKAAIKKYLPRLNAQGVNDFFNDLQASGRVVDKQINNNFYNEQVQKAEPYNETAQEFADRLRSYGATDSQINENINSAQIEEQQAEQTEEQTEILQLAPPVEQQFEDIRSNVRKYLDEKGLKDVGLRFSKGLESATNLQRDSQGNYSFKENLTDPGIYDQASKEIIINLNALPKQATDIQIEEHIVETVNHEIIHAIRDLDLITEKEYTDLVTYAKKILPARKETRNVIARVQAEYAEQSDAIIDEEIVAELFRLYKLSPKTIAPKPRGILGRINAFLEGISRAFSRSGIVNTSDLLQAIDSGKIGSRQRGVLRSLRETVRDSSQVPVLSSRASTETEPAYMDLTRSDIYEATSFDEHYNNVRTDKNPLGEQIPNAFVMRMPIDAYLRLTTPNEESIAKIKKEVIEGYGTGYKFGKFDPAKVDNKGYPIFLNIDNKGKVTSHEGRHRAALLQREGASTIPVVIKLQERPMEFVLDNPMANIKRPIDLGIIALRNQFGTGYELDWNNQDVAMVRRLNFKEDIDNAVRVANAPDLIIPVLAQKNSLRNESRKLLDVIKNNPEGFTIDAKTGEPITEGFPVAPVKEAEYVIDADNLTEDMVDEYAIILHRMSQSTDKPIRAGGWLNSKDNKYYLDAVIVMDNLADALYYAQAGKQEAVFNLNTFEEIDTNEGIKQLKESGDFSSEQRNVIRRDQANIKRAFRSSRFRNQALQETKQVTVKEYEEAVQNKENLEEQNKRLQRGVVPKYNTEADPLALKTATDVANNKTNPKEDQDIPVLKRVEGKGKVVPNKYKSLENSIGQVNHGAESNGNALLKLMEPLRDGLEKFTTNFRKEIVFKLAKVEKGIKEAQERNPDLIAKENWADTGTIQALLLADRSIGIFQQVLLRGRPNLDMGITSVDESGGLLDVLEYLYTETLDANGSPIDKEALFKMYAIGRRAKRLDENGLEVPVTPEQIELSQEIAKDYPQIEETYDRFQEFNEGIIDFAVDGGILQEEITTDQLINNYNNLVKEPYAVDLSKGEQQIRTEILDLIETYNRKQKEVKDQIETRGTAQIWRENADYYPFYREMVNGNLNAPKIASGYLGGNPLNMRLKGGKEEITPNPIEAISRNYISIITAVNKNVGIQRLTDSFVRAGMAQEVINPRDQKGIDVYPVFIDGQKRYFRVEDPELIDGLQTVGIDELNSVMKFVGTPAGWLRELVTRDPTFWFRNYMRDTLSAAITSGANMTPFIDSAKGAFEDVSALERFGVIGGYDLGRDERGVEDFIKRRTKARNPKNGLDMVTGLWDFLGDQTYRSDYATRKAVYNSVLEETGNEAEAVFQALEVINFNRRGANPLFRVVTAGIPFLNARIQGLDVLYRSAVGQYSASGKPVAGQNQMDFERDISRKMLTRLGLLSLVTAMYWMMTSDEEEYRKLSREERDNFWNFFYGDYRFTVPIPFEVGILAKVIPERALDLAYGEDNLRDFAESMRRQVGGTLKIDPLGFQLFKPLMEVANNKSTFFGTEIVPYYMQKLPPELQYNQSTTEFAKALGDRLNISPIKIDYVLRGYGGTIGSYVLDSVDSVLKETTGNGFIPPRVDQIPVLKAFVRNPEAQGYVQQFYELRRLTDSYVQAVNKLKDEGRLDELEVYMKANRGLAQVTGRVRALNRYMENWRNKRDKILYSDMSGARKKELIKQLTAERDQRLAVVPELRDNADIPLPSISDVVFDRL